VHNLKAMIEGEEMSSSGGGFNPIGSSARRPRPCAWRDVGLARPSRPDRLVRALAQFVRLGSTPAAATRSTRPLRRRDAIVDELGHAHLREVHERTNALANAWLDAGLGEGDGVAIMCRNHRGFIEATSPRRSSAPRALPEHGVRGPAAHRGRQREKPSAIVYDEEFAELLEDAGKRRKRFIGWVDDDSPPDPTLEELIERATPRRRCRRRERARRDPHLGHDGHAEGRARASAERSSPAIALLSRIPLKAASAR
jgi:fatty-acyl-CoA synthase